MKKTIVLFSTLALISLSSVAQNKDVKQPTDKAQVVATPAAPAQNPDLSIKFNQEDHNFGNVPEGPSVSYDFEFKNIGKVPIIFSDVHGSCGCTVPSFPKEPIAPGEKAVIGVKYATDRVGAFTKTVTITSNAKGSESKTLTIKGTILGDDAPKENSKG